MDALISGQAGVAVLIQGNEVSVLELQAQERELPCSTADIPYLFAGANDVCEMRATARTVVLTRLKAAWRSDRALQFTLISLDNSESIENRELAIQCLAELFNDRDIYQHVGNRLSSAPLPSGSDLKTALTLAGTMQPLAIFLRELQRNQGQIARIRAAWDSLSDSLFGTQSAKQEFFEVAVSKGAFRVLADAASDSSSFGLATIQCHKGLMGLPNYRKVLQAWLGQLKPTRATMTLPELSNRQAELSGVETSRYRDRTTSLSVHELFENVKKQKLAIVELLRKGDIERVRTYAAQLMDSQLRTSEPEFAAMSLCDLAQEAKIVRNYSLQLELAQKAVEVAPEDGWAHGQVADAFVCLGQYDNALRSFDLAATFGQSAFAATGRARVLRAKGKMIESLEAYAEVIASFPAEAMPWYGRAEVLRDMWRFDEALQVYELAIEKFPSERVPRCGRAAVLTDMGRLDDALKAYDRTIEEFGYEVVTVCGRADVLKEMGKLNLSLEAYTNAIRAFPLEPIPRSGQADVLMEMGRFGEARMAYSRAADIFPYEAVGLSGAAETLKGMGQYEQALAGYEEALKKFPDDLRIRNGRADVLKRLGRLKDSLKTYDENIQRSPYDLVARSGRADLLKELGKLKEAASAYDFLISQNPGKQNVRNAKAAILVILRRYEEALTLLPEGEPQTRDEWVGHHIRGMIFLKRGRLDIAMKLFEQGLLRNPFAKERKYFENALAVVKLRMKRFDQAIAHLGEGPEPLKNVLRMHGFGGLGKLDKVREAFQILEGNCPPNLVPLRNELAARYRLSPKAPGHRAEWLFDEECRNVLLEAA